MATRENKVEAYLCLRVKKLGGDCRKFVSPSHAGVPDQIAFVKGAIHFVEVKTVDGSLSPVQKREHDRLKRLGANVVVVFGRVGVSNWIESL